MQNRSHRVNGWLLCEKNSSYGSIWYTIDFDYGAHAPFSSTVRLLLSPPYAKSQEFIRLRYYYDYYYFHHYHSLPSPKSLFHLESFFVFMRPTSKSAPHIRKYRNPQRRLVGRLELQAETTESNISTLY